jgi:hypothetical protein
MKLSTTMSSPAMLLSGCSSLTVRPDDDYATHPSATNPFSRALHIKNPSSTKCAASIQSAARLATVLIARACRFTARGRIGFAATGRRVVVAHSEKRVLVSSRKKCLRDHAQGSYRCSGRRIARRFANSREQRAYSSPRHAAGSLRPRVFRAPLSCKPRNWRGRNYQR